MSRLLALSTLVFALATTPVAFAAPDANPANMPAGSYVLEKTHASINAKVMHHGYAFYHFRFDKFDASYDYDPKDPTSAKVVVTVDTKSMNTGYAKADEKFPVEFLAADKHPTATFKSTKITVTQANKGTMTGDLTLGGVTKPISLDVVFNGAGKDMWGAMRSGFSATTTIKRSEFGLTKYVPAIGDDVALAIEVEFVKK
ncbi:YceI family protein [Agitococcus lubricus]|uniref:Polyisoprenoid-binding protein YceI n=1 Tax=Agitococcus lubricus TaxID=1077255 RepID=A0A2T5J2U9_9GAMM|nr:YceI family protein [Agitococcus lubricus]PTQ90939.1 polyisoprenoid-binding protein YceI [Agitococcus lubricus]